MDVNHTATEIREKLKYYMRLEDNETLTGNVYDFDKMCNLEEMIENKIKDLKMIATQLNDEIAVLHNRKVSVDKELQQKIKDDLQMKEIAEKKELKDLHEVQCKLEKEIELINEGAKPLDSDIEILDKNRKCVRTYKNLTGIKWNYAVNSMCQGIAYNPVKDHLKHISYTMKEKKKVWDEIEECSHASWAHITEDTNPVQEETQLQRE